eukprot:SAG31_NODE_4162_length_3521_cov_31.856224_4_plen_113_part_00
MIGKEDFIDAISGFLPDAKVGIEPVVAAIEMLRSQHQPEQMELMSPKTLPESSIVSGEDHCLKAVSPEPQLEASAELNPDTSFCIESFPLVQPAAVKSVLKQVHSQLQLRAC